MVQADVRRVIYKKKWKFFVKKKIARRIPELWFAQDSRKVELRTNKCYVFNK